MIQSAHKDKSEGSATSKRGASRTPCLRPSPRFASPICQNVAGGFTLVELLVVSVLLMLLGGALIVMLLTGQTSYFSADASLQVQQEVRKALDYMVHELRESGRIWCGSGASPATWPAGNCNSTRLNFRVARRYDASTGSIVWGSDQSDTDFVHYEVVTVSGRTRLQRFRGTTDTMAAPNPCSSATCTVLANNIRLTPGVSPFTWNDTNRVMTITIEVSSSSNLVAGAVRTTSPLTAQVRLRNGDT